MLTNDPTITLSELCTLNESDLELRDDIVAILNEGPGSPDYEVLRDNVTNYPSKLIYALAQDPLINKFLETDVKVNQVLSAEVKKANLPGESFNAFDRSTKVSTFMQFKGVVLLNAFYENKNLYEESSLQILDEACKMGVYQALVLRANYNVDLLREECKKPNGGNIDAYLKSIYVDVTKLSNQYWSLGSLAAAITLINVVDCLYPIARYEIDRFFLKARMDFWSRSYDTCPKSLVPLASAMENLYFTQMVHNFEESKMILQAINEGRSIFLGYEKLFNSSEKLSKIVMQKLESINVPCVESFCEKAFDRAVRRVKKMYPNFVPPDFKFSSGLVIS